MLNTMLEAKRVCRGAHRAGRLSIQLKRAISIEIMKVSGMKGSCCVVDLPVGPQTAF